MHQKPIALLQKQVIFSSEKHKNFYNEQIMAIVSSGKKVDCYVKPLLYLLSLCEDTRRNIDNLYDMENGTIKPEGLQGGWLTSSTKQLCQLAFNLFNGYTKDGRKSCSKEYTPYYLFANEWATYFVQAIQLRYPEYFRTRSVLK